MNLHLRAFGLPTFYHNSTTEPGGGPAATTPPAPVTPPATTAPTPPAATEPPRLDPAPGAPGSDPFAAYTPEQREAALNWLKSQQTTTPPAAPVPPVTPPVTPPAPTTPGTPPVPPPATTEATTEQQPQRTALEIQLETQNRNLQTLVAAPIEAAALELSFHEGALRDCQTAGDFASVTFDANGQPDPTTLRAALTAIAQRKPYLLRKGTPVPTGGGAIGGSTAIISDDEIAAAARKYGLR